MEEKILSLMVSIQADMLEIKTDLKQVNKRLENLEAGQKSLENRIISLEAGQKSLENRIISLEAGQKSLENRIISLEAGQKSLENRIMSLEAGQKSLEAGQESIKQYIKENNLAIAEIITEAFEENARRSHSGNVYRLIPVES